MNSNSISHRGRIVAIDPEFTSVEIFSEDACCACHAKNLCSLSESKSKLIELPTRGWDNYKVGDEVEVALKASLGHKAVWIAYVVPLIILVVSLLGSNILGASELLSGLIAIGLVAIYYFGVWLFRKQIAKEYNFYIK